MLNIENVDLLIQKSKPRRKKKQLKFSAAPSQNKYQEEYVDLGSVQMEDILSLVDKSLKNESVTKPKNTVSI